MSIRGEVLVAIINKQLDFAILREKLWYRIPVVSVEKWMKDRWPPKWLAFYQTKAFDEEAHSINYFAQVRDIHKVKRSQLFPDDTGNSRNEWFYYQIFVEPIQRLLRPVISRRWRRIVFITTTWEKFARAGEINDLYDESTLEDLLWAEFKRLQISAERQEFVRVNKNDYALDFALYCLTGKIDVETDGDYWHINPEQAAKDYPRDNDLSTAGWQIIRFDNHDIHERIQEFVLPTVVKNIEKFGGIDEGKVIPRKIDLNNSGTYQLSMFDDL